MMGLGRIFLKLVMFWLPVPVTLVMAYLWRRQTGNSLVTAYAILMPLSYGYIMPCIAINMLKRWRFKNGFMLGGMYIHHGFMYASKMSLFGFLPLLLLGKGSPDWAASIAWVVCTTLPYAFTAWLQDSLSVKHGFVEFTSEVPEEINKAAKTLSYAPLCFTVIGLIYSIGLVATYASCIFGNPSLLRILIIFIVSFAALMTLPSIAYRVSLNAEVDSRLVANRRQ
jgi:hypothetical protein